MTFLPLAFSLALEEQVPPFKLFILLRPVLLKEVDEEKEYDLQRNEDIVIRTVHIEGRSFIFIVRYRYHQLLYLRKINHLEANADDNL